MGKAKRNNYYNETKSNVAQISSDSTESYSNNFGYKDWVLSQDQKTLGNVMRQNDLIFVSGRAGSGKTAGVLYHYIQDYLNDKDKKIVVIRTPVEAGLDKIGALPNGLSDKIEPHFSPAKKILTELLNGGKVQCDLEKRIEFKIPNFALGDTFKDCLIVISEAQQLPPLILKLLLERIGEGLNVWLKAIRLNFTLATAKEMD